LSLRKKGVSGAGTGKKVFCSERLKSTLYRLATILAASCREKQGSGQPAVRESIH